MEKHRGIDVTFVDYIRHSICLYPAIEGGKFQSGPLHMLPSDSHSGSLTDPTTGAGVGIVYMTDQKFWTAMIDNARGDLPVVVRIFTPFGEKRTMKEIRSKRC